MMHFVIPKGSTRIFSVEFSESTLTIDETPSPQIDILPSSVPIGFLPTTHLSGRLNLMVFLSIPIK